jgi:hypothetical protein
MAGQTLFQDDLSFFGGGIKTAKGVGFVIGQLNSATSKAGSYDADLGLYASGLLIQQISANTKRPISTIFDLADRAVYYVAGREQATIQMNRIIGPAGTVVKYYAELGDICKSPMCTFDFNSSTCVRKEGGSAHGSTVDSKAKLYAMACVLVDVTFASSVQDYVCTEAGVLQSTSLRFEGEGENKLAVNRG